MRAMERIGETARQRDSETARQRDSETARQRDEDLNGISRPMVPASGVGQKRTRPSGKGRGESFDLGAQAVIAVILTLVNRWRWPVFFLKAFLVRNFWMES